MRRAIQVLIVIVILLTCSGIFSVFLEQVRDAASRTQCSNNLRQLGLDIENYHAMCNKFPMAAGENPDLPPEKRLSWIVGIVPFFEKDNTYSRMDHKKGWDAEENRFAAEKAWKVLLCPGYPEEWPIRTLMPTHYLGISGIGDDAIALPREDPHSGFFGYDRPVKREELKRGLAETFLIVETSKTSGCWTAAGSPTTRGLIPDGSPYIGEGRQFGGNHRRGANVAFADGSVRFIEQSIDPAVWEAMATLSGKGNQE
jgi:prepilin-type processing-associated H-X9-DG protein